MTEKQRRVLDLALRYARLMTEAAENDWEQFPQELSKNLSVAECDEFEKKANFAWDVAQDILQDLEDAAVELDRSAEPNETDTVFTVIAINRAEIAININSGYGRDVLDPGSPTLAEQLPDAVCEAFAEGFGRWLDETGNEWGSIPDFQRMVKDVFKEEE